MIIGYILDSYVENNICNFQFSDIDEMIFLKKPRFI